MSDQVGIRSQDMICFKEEGAKPQLIRSLITKNQVKTTNYITGSANLMWLYAAPP